MPIWLFGLLMSMVLLLMSGQVYLQVSESRQIEAWWHRGELRPRKIEAKSVQYPVVVLGTAKLVNQVPGGTIFLVGSDPISVWLEDGKLFVSAIIRNEKGDMIARIDANRFMVIKGYGYDYNFDSSALEIVDSHRNLVFQLEIKGEKAYLRGIFHDRKGQTFVLGNNAIQILPPHSKLETSFTPMFQYPSYKHPGERISPR